MDAFVYLFLAYSFIWVGIFGFIWYMYKKTTSLEQQVELLQEMVNEKN